MTISKTKYCNYISWPKKCWLSVHKPELVKIDAGKQHRFDEGHEVGELAKGLFGPFVDVTTNVEDGSLDIAVMIAKTRAALEAGVETICEAAFSKDGLYCAVDVLHKENGGYAIYEVKSTNSVKSYHYPDIAFQKYLLELCGITVTGTYLVHLNRSYLRKGNLEVSFGKLFVREDVSKKIIKAFDKVKTLSDEAKALLDEPEPKTVFGSHCTSPYACDYFEYCKREAPKPSVLDVYDFGERWQLYNGGIRTFEDLLASGHSLTAIQRRQIEYSLATAKSTYINPDGIKSFLDKLTYPLYFLDFESMMPALPPYDDTHSYQQIPFQYSLHILEGIGGKIEHREFLGEPEADPRRTLAERLVRDIPHNACVVAYNADFEKGRLEDLAKLFPDLKEHLLNIRLHIVDMLVPFQSGYYYNRDMGGSFSVKSVLPAIFPNDPELDYHNLDGVHNGTEAKDVFPTLPDMPPEERECTRKGMLAYCKLDTYAMVKIWQEFLRVTR